MCIIYIIAGGSKKQIVAKSFKKSSKLSIPKDNSTDETDSEIKHHGKEQIPSTDVQQTCFKSLTKTIHWNRIKRKNRKSENSSMKYLGPMINGHRLHNCGSKSIMSILGCLQQHFFSAIVKPTTIYHWTQTFHG